MRHNEFQATNIHSWIAVFAFFFTIICAIICPKISVTKLWRFILNVKEKTFCCSAKHDGRKAEIVARKTGEQIEKYFEIAVDIGVAPIISIIFLFMTTTLNSQTFLEGVLGNEKIKPYSVLILFMSLSYCCVSLDTTGLFEFIAINIILMSKKSGIKLYFGFCLFASVLTVFTSNDIVIMTLTPIICSVSVRTQNIDPIPFVISQYFLANIWSMTLMIGNPTNIIVAEAVNLNFLNYTKWMALPTITAGLTCQLLLYWIFHKRIPKIVIENNRESVTSIESNMCINQLSDNKHTINEQTIKPVLEKKRVAIIKSLLFLFCLICLAVVSVVQPLDGFAIYSYMVTFTFFVIFFLIDLIQDVIALKKQYKNSGNLRSFGHSSILYKTLKRIPWKIIPFALGMFIIVAVLKYYGFVGALAKYITQLINYIGMSPSNDPSTHQTFAQQLRSTASAVFITTYLSSFLCNILNNQPMTILFTDMLLSDQWINGTTNMYYGSQFGLIAGSNLGANITLIGALAGILWINILKQFNDRKISKINFFVFAKYGAMITPVVIFSQCLTLVFELIYF